MKGECMKHKMAMVFGFFLTGFICLQAQAVTKATTTAKTTPPSSLNKPLKSKAMSAPANGVVTSKNPVYTLRLNSNPTTGFSWFMVSYPKNLVNITKHKFIPPNSKLIGAGGVSVWQFKATPEALAVPTVIKVEMMYARPWGISSQSTVQTFYIVTT